MQDDALEKEKQDSKSRSSTKDVEKGSKDSKSQPSTKDVEKGNKDSKSQSSTKEVEKGNKGSKGKSSTNEVEKGNTDSKSQPSTQDRDQGHHMETLDGQQEHKDETEPERKRQKTEIRDQPGFVDGVPTPPDKEGAEAEEKPLASGSRPSFDDAHAAAPQAEATMELQGDETPPHQGIENPHHNHLVVRTCGTETGVGTSMVEGQNEASDLEQRPLQLGLYWLQDLRHTSSFFHCLNAWTRSSEKRCLHQGADAIYPDDSWTSASSTTTTITTTQRSTTGHTISIAITAAMEQKRRHQQHRQPGGG